MDKDDNVKVMVRVRPLSQKEIEEGSKLCVKFEQYNSNSVILDCVQEQKNYSFDWVGGLTTTQEDIFTHVGLPLVKTCLEGKIIIKRLQLYCLCLWTNWSGKDLYNARSRIRTWESVSS